MEEVMAFITDKHEECIKWTLTHLGIRYKGDVEDIIQDTVVELLEEGKVPTNPDRVKEYVFSALKNNARDYMKKEDRRAELLRDNREAVLMGFPQEQGDSPEAVVEAEESLEKKLKELSPLLRATLERTAIDGVTPEELAEEEGSDVKAVYERIRVARNILRGNDNE